MHDVMHASQSKNACIYIQNVDTSKMWTHEGPEASLREGLTAAMTAMIVQHTTCHRVGQNHVNTVFTQYF